jgi:hypothetical protein
LGKHSYPAAFFFLPGKKRCHYHEALKLLKVHVEAMDSSSPLPLRRFLIDFESAVMSEIRNVFGKSVAVSGCYVHMRRNLRRRLQELKYLQTLALQNVRFNFFVSAIAALAFVPLDEIAEYYKALIDEELPHVMADIRHQLEVEEDDPTERFSDVQKSVEKFLDYVESAYIGKVVVKLSNPA